MAERVGFEPTCRFPDKTLSRRPRYDHFGTSPFVVWPTIQVLVAPALPLRVGPERTAVAALVPRLRALRR